MNGTFLALDQQGKRSTVPNFIKLHRIETGHHHFIHHLTGMKYRNSIHLSIKKLESKFVRV
jgi:hypothetical protein